jgi:hypothetical protein
MSVTSIITGEKYTAEQVAASNAVSGGDFLLAER